MAEAEDREGEGSALWSDWRSSGRRRDEDERDVHGWSWSA
jgi:hypothetical protein